MGIYAVVTGASSGIGKSICFELAKRGYNLIIISKNEALLNTAKQDINALYPNTDVKALATDLAIVENAHKIADECITLNVDINMLVNCAGYAVWTKFGEGDLSDQLAVVNLNVHTPLILSHKLLPILKKQPKSYILNVSSTTIFQTTPFLTTYSSSKTFIKYFTDCLRMELKDENIVISCLIPGSTKTNFGERADLSNALKQKAEQVEMTANEVAKIAIDSVFKGKKVIVPGFLNKAHHIMTKILPASLAAKMTYSIYKK